MMLMALKPSPSSIPENSALSLNLLKTSIRSTASAGNDLMAVLTSSPKNSLPSTKIFLMVSPCASTEPLVMVMPGIFFRRPSTSASFDTLNAPAL